MHVFVRNCQIGFKLGVQFCIPTRNCESFICSASSVFYVVILKKHFSHSSEFILVSHCYFTSHFPNDDWFWLSFICLFAIHISPLISMSSYFHPFSFIRVFSPSMLSFKRFKIYFSGYNSLSEMWSVDIFSFMDCAIWCGIWKLFT